MTALPQTSRFYGAVIALICFGALAAAFIAEAFLNLEPCTLCIYQRYPFAIGLALGILSVILHTRKKITAILFAALGLNFLANTAIAAYHTGIERKWWASKIEGCSTPFFEKDTNQSILENIMSAPLGNCSEIPWQDPLLGLSMANYNVALCLGLSALCAFALVKSKA